MTVKINADTSDGLKFVSDTSGAIDFQSNGVTKMSMDASGNLTANSFVGGGKVLQVVQTIKTNTTTVSNPTSYTEVSGLTVNITPSSASNKVLIIGTYCIMGDTNTQGYAAFYRDTTQIGVGNAVGNRIKASTQAYPNHINQATNSSFCFLDSPSSTSQITYALRTRNQGSGNVYVNRSQTYTNSAASSTNASTITVMEIQG